MQRAVIITATLLACAALVVRVVSRGGPYFTQPATIVDHVGPGKHEIRDALVLLPRVRPLLPRGARVTCFRPTAGGEQQDDGSNYLTAIGMLPYQRVEPPFTAGLLVPRPYLIDYVVALGRPFTHPAYKPIAGWPEGTLYKVQR